MAAILRQRRRRSGMSNKLGNKLCRPSLFERVSRVPTLFDPDRRRNCRYRLNTDRDQAIDHVAFVFLAWTVGIRPDDDVAPSKWRPVCLVGGIAAVWTCHDYTIGQELLRSVSRLLALGDIHLAEGPLR